MTAEADTKKRPLSLAIERQVLAWRELDWPIDWSAVFGRRADLVLEIGFGNGEFLAHLGRQHPERDHVGIELSWSGAFRLLKRLGPGASNVRALLIDAEVALQRLFEPGSLAEVVVNHPCPWPKDRHHTRRLLKPSMLRLLADRMRDGAPITVVTDHAEYAEWVHEQLTGQSELVSRHDTVEVPSIPGRITSKYERKAMAQGIAIHYFEWRKAARPQGVPAPDPVPSAFNAPMPSVKLSGAPSDPFVGFDSCLWRETHDDVEIVVRMSGAYRRTSSSEASAEPASWLIETLVQEGGLRQDFAIVAVARQPDELLLKLSDLGHPHPTHGVRRALFALARWIQERHPSATVLHENLGAAAMEAPTPSQTQASGD